MRILYKVLSVLFHPVFLTAALTGAFYSMGDYHQEVPVWQSMQIIVTNTLIFPTITVLILKGLGMIKSIELQNQKDRIIPTIASMTFYFWAYLVARNKGMDPAIVILLLSGFLSFIILILLGIAMKPSLHASAWAIACAWSWTVYSLGKPQFLIAALMVTVIYFLVIISRLALKAHSKKEIAWGTLCGLLSVALAYGFLGW